MINKKLNCINLSNNCNGLLLIRSNPPSRHLNLISRMPITLAYLAYHADGVHQVMKSSNAFTTSFKKEFDSYHEIRSDLQLPIAAEGLDSDTLIRLYESKLVYMENLRAKAFYDINRPAQLALFSLKDYSHIIESIKITKTHLKTVMLGEIRNVIQSRKAG